VNSWDWCEVDPGCSSPGGMEVKVWGLCGRDLGGRPIGVSESGVIGRKAGCSSGSLIVRGSGRGGPGECEAVAGSKCAKLQRRIKLEHRRCNRIKRCTWKGARARQTVPPQQRDIK
jgi:hypothetical protein